MPLQSRRVRLALRPVMLLVLAAWGPQGLAQQELPAPALRTSPSLGERIAPEIRPQLPVFVEGDRISGRPDLDTSVEGRAVLRRGDVVIRADRLEYEQSEDLARARGAVRVNRAGDVFEGPHLEMRLESFEGFFTQPSYSFLANGGHGRASRIDFLDADRAVIHDATYTTCVREPGDTGWPQWVLTANEIHIDNASETAYARGALVRFFGVPVLPVPALSFPLSDRRKSGFLTPNLGVDNRSGLEYTQPYYFNIAPNRDATLYPTIMTRRGVELGGEFRYLEPGFRGQLAAAVLPGDRLRDRDRWSWSLQHAQAITGLVPGAMSLGLQVNRVSDDDYWRDFRRPRVVTSLTQRLLASDGQLNWGLGPYAATLRLLKWQTLQDITAPIVPPYDRLPQLQGRYSRPDLPFGMIGYVEADYTRFQSTPSLTRQPDAQRSYMLARLARPWQAPGWFFTPRLQLHATQYQFDESLPDGRTAAHRAVPTISLDSGLIFERETLLLGRSLIQTLEPRAFYVYTPFREQSRLPNYDSGRFDFNFATIYTENAYVGHDRIADNRLLTLGLATRLQDPVTGAELARGAIAQRLRFDDQRVVLPGESPVVDRLSDVLLGGSINWAPHWTIDTTLQYNPKTSRSERVTLGTRYNPTPYRVVNAAYRTQRVLSEQLDLGWQWPINDLWGDRGQALGPGRGQGGGRWYSVGRLNYSLKDRRLVDSILGVEYDGCCWIGRVVVERLDAGQSGANKRILLQLEFLGLTRLGSNAVGTFRTHIPRYQFLREQVDSRSRFMNYE
jgi:LPS-assembly protein